MSTVNLDCKLDLKAIALQARNAEYNPKVGLLFQCIFCFHFYSARSAIFAKVLYVCSN